MGDYLSVVSHALPPALFQPEAVARIRALASRLPACAAAGFECRLGPDDPRADFHVFLPATGAALPLIEDAAWQRVRRLARLCAASDSALGQAAFNFVLEFDLEAVFDALPAPSFFVGFRHGSEVTPELLLGAAEGADPRWMAALRPQLEKCLERLTPGAFVSHFGAMLSRSEPVIRLNVGGMSPDEIAAYLRGLEWEGHLEGVRSAAGHLRSRVDSLSLCLDVCAAGPARRIGFECFLSGDPGPHHDWTPVLDYLVGEGLCSSAKAQALGEWPGIDRPTASDSWPAALAAVDRFLGREAVSCFFRRVSHVKAIFSSGRLCEAKAYLLFGHEWVCRTRGRPAALSLASGSAT